MVCAYDALPFASPGHSCILEKHAVTRVVSIFPPSMIKALKKLVLQLLVSRGYCISFGEPATLAGIISAFDRPGKDFFFVQVGAYDGRESDPIRDFVRERHWRGILVEPQPDAFARLKKNYAGCPGLFFENVAISTTSGDLPFYRLKDEHAHLFHAGHELLSSLDPDHVLKHLTVPMDAATALECTSVPCITFTQLLERHNAGSIDLLQIDAEGYDFKIISSIDFSKTRPSVIRFEHMHLTGAEKLQCLEMLVSHGYKLVVGGCDITAFQSRWIYD